jgi:hypothetical protein
MKHSEAMLLACLVAAAALAGCRVNVNKGADGQEKTVQVDTPFGGMHVNTNQLTASDVGLPAYPGATIVNDDENNKSADVHMGFGQWQLRVRVISYTTTDSADKVMAFYKKALGRYGDVITCRNKTPVGTPTVTSEGLTCADQGSSEHTPGVTTQGTFSTDKGLQLEAGSKHHRHVVAIQDAQNGKTQFGLIELQLPTSASGSSGPSD